MRRYGVHHLFDSRDSSSHPLQVMEVEDGTCTAYFPLDGEQPFTEWIGGTAVLSGCENLSLALPSDLQEIMHALLSVPGSRVWHISSAEWSTGRVQYPARL